ncbi:cation:proton antiporter, partial [Phascolarctobacterium faecium]
MSELAPLIEDLAFILVLAGIVTIFCKKFNQPLVLGYILAGFFASPHFNLLPNVVDTANITVWSDIGVIFILFNLGLDFNFAKIKSIGGTALIAAVTELT